MEFISLLLDTQGSRMMGVLGVILIVGGLLIALTALKKKAKASRRKGRWNRQNQTKNRPRAPADKTYTGKTSTDKTPAELAADQLKTVSEARFVARRLLNASEAKVFDTLNKAVSARNPQWQVMAQVSLGEFLASADKDAFLAVNSKRVDFALMDANYAVRHAIEYQGSGHHTGTSAAARDAVKKEALRKAGIGYHEVVAGHTTPNELRALVEKLVPGAHRGPAPLRDAANG